MMFGKDGKKWHEEGQPVKEKKIVGYDVYKTGEKKGKKKPVYDWVVKTHKRRVVVDYSVYKSGKNKGKEKPIYETKEVPVPSTGFYPTVNHIYLSAHFRGGGGRRLKPIAENHLEKWKSIASDWKEKAEWDTVSDKRKVAIDLKFFLPSGKKDTHNAKKLLLDALQGIVHEDDYYILDRTIDFEIDDNNPRIEAKVYIPKDVVCLN